MVYIMDPMTVNMTCDCPFCGTSNDVLVETEGLKAWHNGIKIQDALPDLTPEERELLITGICPECWNKSFGDC